MLALSPRLLALLLSLQGGENLIQDGAARNAGRWRGNGPSELFRHDRAVGAAAPGSLSIERPAGADGTAYNWFQRVELPRKAPRRLKLEVRVRALDLAPSSEACVMVQVRPEEGDPLAYAWADKVRGDCDWTATRAIFDVPEGARAVHVLAYLSGQGHVWFDDFVLEETEEPVTSAAVAGGSAGGATEELARRVAAEIPWLFAGEAARERAREEEKPVLVYLRCTDGARSLEAARTSLEAAPIPLREDGYAKDLLFRAWPLSSPEIATLIARRTVPVCLTYELASARGDSDLPSAWSHTPGAASVTFRFDGEVGRSRPGSLRIDNSNATDRDPHNWRQTLALPAELPASCRLAASVRTRDFAKGSEACVIVNCFDAQGGMLSHTRLPEIRADGDWKEGQTSFQIPASCTSAVLMAYLVGAGTAWFDDLSIERKGARGRAVELLRNGGTEAHGDAHEGFAFSPGEVTTPALLLTDCEGRVLSKLHRIGTLSDDLVDHWLRAALAAAGQSSKARRAEELYQDGELERLLALTRSDPDPEARLWHARALLRRGDLPAAEEALGTLADGPALAVRAWIGLRRGEWEHARELLERAAGELDGEARLEASFWSAWCTALLGRQAEARERWRELASGGESPARRRAAACLLEDGPRPFQAATTLLWPRTKELPEQSEGPYGGGYDRVRSTTALLELQNDDGSFGTHQGAPGLGFIDPAVTAIAARALARVEPKLPSALAQRAQGARERAIAYLGGYAAREQPSFRAMDPFNLAYATLTLLEGSEHAPCERLIARMAALQLRDGNWTVYAPERPASFNTALCLLALRAARSAGVSVAEDVLERGLAALEAMRQPDDLFPYSTAPGHEWMTTPHGSIARDPLCEEALLACGRGSRERLAASLGRYLTYHAELRTPTKRLYDYFDERGHGGYYFFFAHDNALRAARAWAEPALAREVEARARAAVLAAMEGDGTWMDKFLLGRAYGTAMALLLLE